MTPSPTRAGLAVVVAVILATATAACDSLPMPGLGPRAVVGNALDAIVARDLVRANAWVCPEERNVAELPISVVEFSLPFGSLADISTEQALSVATLDASGVGATETFDGDRARVHLAGALGVGFDPTATRALLTALSANDGIPDEAEIERIMLVVDAGPFKKSVDATVELARRNGAWLICQQLAPGDP